MRLLLVVVFLALPTLVYAQQQPSIEVQVLQAKLMQELSSGLQCNSQTIILQQQITKLEAEIKSLKETKK